MRLLLIISLLLTVFVIKSDKAGLRAAVRKQVMLDAVKKFFPLIMQQISDINIPDQHISIPLSFLGNLDIDISGIHFHINPLPAENIAILLQEPNIVGATANGVSGNGHMNIRFHYLVSETDSVDIYIKKLNIVARCSITEIESPQEKGKMLPFAKIEGIDIDLDFDFDIHGSIIAGIVELVKGKIKDLIFNQLKGTLVNAIINEADKFVRKILSQLPLYLYIKDGIAIDYSLEAPPKIKNDYLILSINGGIIDINHPETKNPPFPIPESLPDYYEQGKNGQGLISDYFLLTALRTLYLTKRLNFRLKSEDVPSGSPISLDTTTLDWLLPGIEKAYGSNRKVDLECQANKNASQPIIALNEKTINGTLYLGCGLEVDTSAEEDGYERALTLTINFNFFVNISVAENGTISANVDNAQFNNATLIQSTIPDLDIKKVEQLFDFALDIGLPIVNQKFLNNATIPLPTIEGISFTDSTAEVDKGYILVNLNPKFN